MTKKDDGFGIVGGPPAEEAMGWVYVVGYRKMNWCRVGSTRANPLIKAPGHGTFFSGLEASLPFQLDRFALFATWGWAGAIIQIIGRKYAPYRVKRVGWWMMMDDYTRLEMIELINRLNMPTYEALVAVVRDLELEHLFGPAPATSRMLDLGLGRHGKRSTSSTCSTVARNTL